MAKPERHVLVCAQNRPPGHPRGCCVAKGSGDLLQTLWAELQKRGVQNVAATFSGCLGPCDAGANVLVYPEGVMYSAVTRNDMAAIVEEHLLGGRPVERLLATSEAWS